MERFAKELKRDPQLDSVLRQRGQQLGVAEGSRLARVVQSQGLDDELTRELGLRHGPASAWACEPRRWARRRRGGAERAFEALRAEVAPLRQGIELVYRQGQEAPAVDYSPTLGEMAKTLQAMQGRLAAIEGKPALGLTPQLFRQVIEDAGQRAGERAGRAMADGAAAQSAATRELQALVGRAHTRKDQREWLGVAAACGVMLGVVLMYLLVTVLPWGGGDWLAASLVGGGPWQAGQTLMRDADPEIVRQDGEALQHLRRAAGRVLHRGDRSRARGQGREGERYGDGIERDRSWNGPIMPVTVSSRSD